MDITAVGPHMWIGKLGHFLLLLSFFSAILSAFSYWKSASLVNKISELSWCKLGKSAFIVHGVSLLVVVALVFYLMATKKYAYSYVYQHASNDLPFRYLFAAFWEGQEGSTMLWIFWHVVLGFILLFTAKKWQATVVGTIALVNIFLVSMLLGIYIFGHRIGVSPFYLLKSSAANAPIFAANPNFVPQDGQGLNELLRNYWMVIHPPTVFLGFAAITVPFGYALGGLYWRKLQNWITPALPWALLAAGILGLGVLMGGAWAYEALSFGGFWVWDPVENASLVPWLLIVSALHLMLVFRATGYSGLITFVLIILSFLTVAYSTFLTKSGVLGEASVHSFTDLGMSGQLMVFILFFVYLSFVLLLSNTTSKLIYSGVSLILFILYLIIGQAGIFLIAFLVFSFAILFTVNDFPEKEGEESVWSREFWMFLGSVLLLLSALHISLATSVPVYNKLFDTEYAVFDEAHFNSIQIWPAIFILVLSAIVLYLDYGGKKKLSYSKQFGWPVMLSLAFTILFTIIYKFSNPLYILLMLVSLFSFFANANYLFNVLKGRVKIGGASIAHIGFALLLCGVVISQSKKEVISTNAEAFVNVNEENEDLNENHILLYEEEPKSMGEYIATFKEDVEGKLRDGVIVDFKKLNEDNTLDQQFELVPKFKLMGETSVADPAIKRRAFYDFFTHISLINLGNEIDTTAYEPITFAGKQDTVVYDRMVFVLEDIRQGTNREDIEVEDNDIPISAEMKVITKDSIYEIEPVYLIRNNQAGLIAHDIPEEKISLRINDFKPDSEEIEFGIKSSRPFKKYIAIKAMIFPMINLVWLGSLLMFAGFIISMIERRKQASKLK